MQKLQEAALERFVDADALPFDQARVAYRAIRAKYSLFDRMVPQWQAGGFYCAAVTLKELEQNACLPQYFGTYGRRRFKRGVSKRFGALEFKYDDTRAHLCITIVASKVCIFRHYLTVNVSPEAKQICALSASVLARAAHAPPTVTADEFMQHYQAIRAPFRAFVASLVRTLDEGYYVAFVTHQEYETHSFTHDAIVSVSSKRYKKYPSVYRCKCGKPPVSLQGPNIFVMFHVSYDATLTIRDEVRVRKAGTCPCFTCAAKLERN